jgi:hypothetical protein
MCIILKQILLYGSDVQLYNEKAFQNNLSIDITEEGSDVGDDSDDGDFEPSLNFTLKVCHVNFICFSCNLHT